MSSSRPEVQHDASRAIRDAMRRERVVLELDDPEVLAALRADADRIARGMDREDEPPPMLWSGIPLPSGPTARDSDWSLALSVGGTNTTFFLLRLEDGALVGLDASGREVRGAELDRARAECRVPTPKVGDVADGFAMLGSITRATAAYLDVNRRALDRCEHIILSWGFGSEVIRTDEARVLGGLRVVTTQMTKEQAGFQTELAGRDIAELFAAELEGLLAWSCPITVANDGVVAIHYFLTDAHRARYRDVGVFINGTGSNFSIAEPYAVRGAGIASDLDEFYQPERIVAGRRLRSGERERRFLINYEIGSIDLDATKTRFDREHEYPIEMNALSGGNAFAQQFRELTRFFVGSVDYDACLRALGRVELGAREVAELARRNGESTRRIHALDSNAMEALHTIAEAVVTRSALHVALILAAVTRRTSYGRGDAARAKPDLLALEGSIWKIPGYTASVVASWDRLIGGGLRVETDHEQNYDASSKGAFYLAVLHSRAGGG